MRDCFVPRNGKRIYIKQKKPSPNGWLFLLLQRTAYKAAVILGSIGVVAER